MRLSNAFMQDTHITLFSPFDLSPAWGFNCLFFIAAYFMLSDFPQLAGSLVPVLGDLGKPDTLLFGNIHLMPFVMTLVNVLGIGYSAWI